ncbi:MAG: hypothetical protein HFI29_11815 [Lachnospiraceae bacterium]|jgi:hypothetical protein|nr:hypothetical protein [Lachnospiraceae bacterium]
MNQLQPLYVFWEGISTALRTLSLSGSAGNVLAFLLYTLISLLPLFLPGLWLWRRKRRLWGADLLLPLLSAYTFYLLYVFINPALFYARMPKGLKGEAGLPCLKAVYAGLWLSMLLSWLVLTWIRVLSDEEILDRKEFLYRGMRGLLTASIAILGAALLYSTGRELMGRLGELAVNSGKTETDLAFALLRTACAFLPSCIFLGILWQMKRLLKAMEAEPFGEEELREARRLARVSRTGVMMSVLTALTWNGALFFFAGSLSYVDYRWEISFFPLLAAFGSLILARYLREAGELRRENEMII